MLGKIHSFQSMGAVDGPGLRFIVFMQGCTLRCAYCHNPDTWKFSGAEQYTTDEVVKRAERFKPYFGDEGGVTVSGGEALAQPEFVAELFEKLHLAGINTALDTSGICDIEKAKMVLKHTDLCICDIKFSTEDLYKKYTGGSLEKVKTFLKLTNEMKVPLWIRNVIVPNLTDSKENVNLVVKIASEYNNVKKIELLPFKKLCITKYENMGINFPLKSTPECTVEKIEQLNELLPQL